MFDEPAFPATLRLGAIVESSDDAIVSKDLNGVITSWNRAAERMFGYTAAEAIGRPIRIIIPAERQSEEDEVLRRIRRGDSVDHFETIRVRKDGSRIPISLTVSPIRDASGTVIGASKIARDISDRKRAEAALAQSEARQTDLHQRLVALVSASGSLLGSPKIEDVLPAILAIAGEVLLADGYAVWRFGPVRKVWRVAASSGLSDAFTSAVVTTHEGRDASPVAFTEPIAAEDVQAVPLLAERRAAYEGEAIRSMLAVPLVLEGQATATLVFYFRRRHAFTPVEVESARALGNIAGAALRTADLYTQQRIREQQAQFLARSAAALASSLDFRDTFKTFVRLAVPDITDFCAVDVVTPNNAIERLAMAHDDPQRLKTAEAFHRRYPPNPDDPRGLAEVLRSGKSLLVEELTDEMIVAGARDPEHLEAVRGLGITSFMMVPLRTGRGTSGVMTFAFAESRRRFTSTDLRFAETVADRAAAAIENAWAYDEVRRANQLKDEFLATLSHELRTPLNAMLGYTRMLRGAAVPEDGRDAALEVIERNGRLLAQMVDEVLDVSRIISGKLRLNVQRIDPTRLVDDALATVAPAAAAKGIELRSKTASTVTILHGDPDRLQQVLWNLLTNAVKFTPPGGRIEVSLGRSETDVELTVADTGRGIDSAFLPYIFERFRQGDSRFTREHGGLGLGLSIARHIVEMHGGTIHAESRGEGRGATFRVLLPALANSQRLSRLG
jgi:PAS domain S-box-containing protein